MIVCAVRCIIRKSVGGYLGSSWEADIVSDSRKMPFIGAATSKSLRRRVKERARSRGLHAWCSHVRRPWYRSLALRF